MNKSYILLALRRKMEKDRPKPSYWVINFWNDGDDYRAQKGNFYDEESMNEEYKKLSDYDNRQIIEVFFHVTSASGVEAANDNIDTRDLVYEDWDK
jgi:hypothetical protein